MQTTNHKVSELTKHSLKTRLWVSDIEYACVFSYLNRFVQHCVESEIDVLRERGIEWFYIGHLYLDRQVAKRRNKGDRINFLAFFQVYTCNMDLSFSDILQNILANHIGPMSQPK